MLLVCPVCRSVALVVQRALALVPGADHDESAAQVVSCHRCGLAAVATFEESRRGALDMERIRHTGYWIEQERLQAVASSMANCPAPLDPHCRCEAHRLFEDAATGISDALRRVGVIASDVATFDLRRALPPIGWGSLATACGNAGHVPRALMGLVSPDAAVRDRSYWELDNHVVLQSDLHEAAYFVVAPLLDLLRRRVPFGRDRTYDLLIEIAGGAAPAAVRQRTYEGDELSLQDACAREVRKGLDLFRRDASDADPGVRRGADALLEWLAGDAPAAELATTRDTRAVEAARPPEHSAPVQGATAWAFNSALRLKEMKTRLDAISRKPWIEGDSDYRPDYIGGPIDDDAVARIYELGSGRFVVNLVLRSSARLSHKRLDDIRHKLLSHVLPLIQAGDVGPTEPYE